MDSIGLPQEPMSDKQRQLSELLTKKKDLYGSSLVKIRPMVLDLTDTLQELPAEVLTILKKTGEMAKIYGIKVYLIGGMVRDLLLKRENRDFDFVVNGNLKIFIPALAKELGGEWLYHDQFQTGKIKLSSGFNLDFANSRRERYCYPGALPEVEATDILEDLFRRDYTINVLALGVNPENWGKLIDYFQGKQDLEKGLLRALHRFSFLDDPTRIIRGIRFAAKLDFSFEKETKNLIMEALTKGNFSSLSLSRLIKEFKLIFQDEVTVRLLNILKQIPVFKLLNLDIEIKDDFLKQFRKLEGYLAYYRQNHYNIEEWLLRLAILFEDVSSKSFAKWEITGRQKEILITYSNKKSLISQLNRSVEPEELVNLLANLKIEEIILLLVKASQKKVEENLNYYLNVLSKVKLTIDGFDLQEMGLKPGPEIKYVLERSFTAKLRGKIKNHQEELAYAQRLIKNKDWSD